MTDHTPKGMLRPYDPSWGPTFVRGEGVKLWDDQGKEYYDLTGSYSALPFGHCHPRLVHVASSQLQTLTLVTGASSPWRKELCRVLAENSPWGAQAKVWLCTTGSRGVEVAWKIAHASRPGAVLSFDQGYHGRSIATSLLSNTSRLPILDQEAQSSWKPSDRMTFPDCIRCPFHQQPSDCDVPCLESTANFLSRHAEQISAIIVEPAIGARGYLFAPHRFFSKLRWITRELGVLMISDEIQMGMGRMGGWFASERQGWDPDLIVIGKSLGGGMAPISAVLGTGALMDQLDVGIESETFGANPLACRIAMEVLEMLDEKVLLRALEIGELLRDRLSKVSDGLDSAILQGEGCSAVVEFFPQEPRRGEIDARQFAEKARKEGVLVQWSGPYRNRIVCIPPFTISDEEIEQVVSRLRTAWLR